MTVSATAKWVLLALLGLAIAIAIAIAAANLASQQIGIASESVSAGDALAPSQKTPAEEATQGERQDQAGPEREPTTTTPAEPAPPPEETVAPPSEGGSDDYGGQSPDGDD